jgi:hypothetical protein
MSTINTALLFMSYLRTLLNIGIASVGFSGRFNIDDLVFFLNVRLNLT